jgi:hypothetical protein
MSPRAPMAVKVRSLYVIQLLPSSVNFGTLKRADVVLGSVESILAESGLITCHEDRRVSKTKKLGKRINLSLVTWTHVFYSST